MIWPPAFSIFSLADALNLWAEIFNPLVSSPSPRTFENVVLALDQPPGLERVGADFLARLEAPLKVPHVDRGHFQREPVMEAALGNAADQGHLAAFEHAQGVIARAQPLALVALAGRLAQAGAGASAKALRDLLQWTP